MHDVMMNHHWWSSIDNIIIIIWGYDDDDRLGRILGRCLSALLSPLRRQRSGHRTHRGGQGAQQADFKCTEKCRRWVGRTSTVLALSLAAPQWPGQKNWAEFEVCSLWWRVACKTDVCYRPTHHPTAPVGFLYICCWHKTKVQNGILKMNKARPTKNWQYDHKR